MAERELERDLLASSAEGSAVETEQLREEIKQALTRLNAVLVAHYYTDEAVQSLAEETGGCVADFLELFLIHISEPTRLCMISYAVFCCEKKKNL